MSQSQDGDLNSLPLIEITEIREIVTFEFKGELSAKDLTEEELSEVGEKMQKILLLAIDEALDITFIGVVHGESIWALPQRQITSRGTQSRSWSSEMQELPEITP